jgi:hypothetical protein
MLGPSRGNGLGVQIGAEGFGLDLSLTVKGSPRRGAHNRDWSPYIPDIAGDLELALSTPFPFLTPSYGAGFELHLMQNYNTVQIFPFVGK